MYVHVRVIVVETKSAIGDTYILDTVYLGIVCKAQFNQIF
jgi:hypothetical protein